MKINIITLFPEMFDALHYGVIGKAIKQKKIILDFFNPRHYTTDKRKTVDDRPYGGGPGMLMKVAPLKAAILAAKKGCCTKVLYVSPKGKKFDHHAAYELKKRKNLIFIAGRYEGIDERLIDTEIDEIWSLGDFVLSGGELAIMCMIDAIARLMPGVLGDEQSAQQDSFAHGLLDYPHYTRPEIINHLEVPPVLLSGNHQAIKQWRLKQALSLTFELRPDLLKKKSLTEEELSLLQEYLQQKKK